MSRRDLKRQAIRDLSQLDWRRCDIALAIGLSEPTISRHQGVDRQLKTDLEQAVADRQRLAEQLQGEPR